MEEACGGSLGTVWKKSVEGSQVLLKKSMEGAQRLLKKSEEGAQRLCGRRMWMPETQTLC